LKLILPFFKAYDITNAQMEDFSENNIVLIANSKNTLQHVQAIANSFIVSTSYEHYIKALCRVLSFPYENTYCTKVSLDKYTITKQEEKRLKEIAEEITLIRLIDIPPASRKMEQFSRSDTALIQRLDDIFWSEIPKMSIGKMLGEVITVGGEQKAEAIRDVVKRLGADLADVIYVGDSITDVEAFKLVRGNGGLTVSFNGNSYAVKNAEVAVLSESNLTIAILADLFCRFGKEKTINVLQAWNIEGLKKSGVDKGLLGQLSSLYPNRLPKAQIVTAQNMEALVKESSEFRKKVRGVAIGRLG
jgi:energy-converting hydrogenase A subunit R